MISRTCFLLTASWLAGGAAQAQAPIDHPGLALRPGWLRVSPAAGGGLAHFDSVGTAGRLGPHDQPVRWARLDGHLLVLDENGSALLAEPGLSTVYRAAGWPLQPLQPLQYAGQRLLLLATVDGLLTPRHYQLVELDLAARSWQVLARGRAIGAVRYAPDLARVYFIRNGAAREWARNTK